MIIPSLLAIAIPIVVGILLGVAGVLGLLVGSLSAGFTLAVFMANAGGAWDNAKKMVEEGKAVIVISSELEEILGVSDRIYTLAYGRITGEVKADDATQENLMELMTIEPAREEQK